MMEHSHLWSVQHGLHRRNYNRTEETRQQTTHAEGNYGSYQDDYVKSYSNRERSPNRLTYEEVHQGYEGYQQQRKIQKRKKRSGYNMQNDEASDIPGYDHVKEYSSYHTSGDLVSKASSNFTNVINITNVANYQCDVPPKPTQYNRWDDPSNGTKSNTLSITGRNFEKMAEASYKNCQEDRLYGAHSMYPNAMNCDTDSSKPYTSKQYPRRFDNTHPYEQGSPYRDDTYNMHAGNNDQRAGLPSVHNSQTYNSYGFNSMHVNSPQDGINSGNTLQVAGRNFQDLVPPHVIDSEEDRLYGGHNVCVNTMQDNIYSSRPVNSSLPTSHTQWDYSHSGSKSKLDTSMSFNGQLYKQVPIDTVDQHNTHAGNNFQEIAPPNFQNMYGFHNTMQDSSKPNNPFNFSRNSSDVYPYVQGPINAINEHNTLSQYNSQVNEQVSMYNSHSSNLYSVHSTDVDVMQNNINSDKPDTSQYSLNNFDDEYLYQQKQEQQDAIDEHIKNIYNESLKEKKKDTSTVDEHIKHIYNTSLKEKERDMSIDEHIQNIYNTTLKEKETVEDEHSSSSPVEPGESVYGSGTY